jgi:hypothetical protein
MTASQLRSKMQRLHKSLACAVFNKYSLSKLLKKVVVSYAWLKKKELLFVWKFWYWLKSHCPNRGQGNWLETKRSDGGVECRRENSGVWTLNYGHDKRLEAYRIADKWTERSQWVAVRRGERTEYRWEVKIWMPVTEATRQKIDNSKIRNEIKAVCQIYQLTCQTESGSNRYSFLKGQSVQLCCEYRDGTWWEVDSKRASSSLEDLLTATAKADLGF